MPAGPTRATWTDFWAALALEQLLPIGQEAIDQAGEARRGGVKGGADRICGGLFQFAGDNGGKHQSVTSAC